MLRDNIKERARVVLRELHRLFPNPKIALVYSSVWELVVAVSLSAQCTDKKVNEVTQKLFKKYTSIQEYADADITELEQDIKSTGFYRNKAKNVNAAAKTLIDDFDGTVPQTMKELITLAGVGRKTANVVLAEGFGIVEGIAVDTHVKRLSNKFGLTKNTDPLKIEKDLMELFPKEEWLRLTHRMIEYGRQYSTARQKHNNDDPISIALQKENLL